MNFMRNVREFSIFIASNVELKKKFIGSSCGIVASQIRAQNGNCRELTRTQLCELTMVTADSGQRDRKLWRRRQLLGALAGPVREHRSTDTPMEK